MNRPVRFPQRASHDARDRALDEALAQSFPASDPPAMIEPGSTIEHLPSVSRPSNRGGGPQPPKSQ